MWANLQRYENLCQVLSFSGTRMAQFCNCFSALHKLLFWKFYSFRRLFEFVCGSSASFKFAKLAPYNFFFMSETQVAIQSRIILVRHFVFMFCYLNSWICLSIWHFEFESKKGNDSYGKGTLFGENGLQKRTKAQKPEKNACRTFSLK